MAEATTYRRRGRLRLSQQQMGVIIKVMNRTVEDQASPASRFSLVASNLYQRVLTMMLAHGTRVNLSRLLDVSLRMSGGGLWYKGTCAKDKRTSDGSPIPTS